MLLGQKLRKLRILRDLDVADIASRIGVTKAKWFNIEWCKEEPSPLLLNSMCQVMGVTDLEFNAYFCYSLPREQLKHIAESVPLQEAPALESTETD